MFERILVCLDGSELAEQILPYAKEQAKRFNSKLILFQAISSTSSVTMMGAPEYGASPYIYTAQIAAEENKQAENEAGDYLERVTELLQASNLDVDSVIVRGTTGEAIVNYAEKSSVDLIVLATHGRSGLGRVIFGSVADYILRESGLPILVIKPKEQA